MANRNRTAGHNYERLIAQELRMLGFEAVTSRYESRSIDDSGVDLVSNFPLNPQMKVSITQPNVHGLLTSTDAEIIFFKKVQRSGNRFMVKGEYVMIRKDDFYNKFL